MEASPHSPSPLIAGVAAETGNPPSPHGSVQEHPPVQKRALALLAAPPTMSHSSSASSITLVSDDERKAMSESALLHTAVESAQLSHATSDANNGPDKPETPQKKPAKGWRDEYPFDVVQRENRKTLEKTWISWSKLTLREKYEYRKRFLHEYISETRKCLPYVKRLFITVYRISPWRATLLLFLNLVNGLLPAMTMQTKGSFLILLQTGLENGKLDTRELIKLLINHVVSTVIERANDEILVNVTGYLNTQLKGKLQGNILKGYLNLEIEEMKDEYISLYFNRANKIATDGLSIFQRQLGIFRDITSIMARLATLKNLASRKSWPILFMTGLLPLLDSLMDKMFHGYRKRIIHNYYEFETNGERHNRLALNALVEMCASLRARPELLIFGARDWMVHRFETILESLNKSALKRSQLRMRGHEKWYEFKRRLKQNFLPMTQGAARALLYLVVAYQPDYFGMPISQLTFVESSVEELFSSTAKLKKVISDNLIKDMFEVRNLFECVNYKSKSSTADNLQPYVTRPGGMKIEVKDVSFAYREGGKDVLKNVSFVIEPGQIVSIVGYNGSGKSTLIRLLTLIEKPKKGQILINDVDVSQYDSHVVRTKMSVLFQDFRKYEELNVFDNVAIGRGERTVDLKLVTEASGLSGIHSKIRTWESYYATRLRSDDSESEDEDPEDVEPAWMSRAKPKPERPVPFMAKALKHGLHYKNKVRGKDLRFIDDNEPDPNEIDTRIPEQDIGMDAREEYIDCEWLSGGQWQKVAMARAFMKIKDAELLILDEPSSALDPQAEYEVFKTLMDLRRGKTTIFISHRFHTVRAAAKIMLFEKGQLVEMGTHEELLEINGGKYAHLFRLQSEGYATMNETKSVEKGEDGQVGQLK